MSAAKLTKRRPLSQPMLVRHLSEWQVCYQARGMLDGKTVTAWVYGPDSRFFCLVNPDAEAIQLPWEEACIGDQYQWTVDRVDPQGTPIERLGGSVNVSAAIAVFDYFCGVYPRGVRLRNGARFMRQQGEDD